MTPDAVVGRRSDRSGHDCSAAVLVVFFGPFPSYSRLTLQSMERNGGFTWIFITDQELEPSAPNIHVVRMTLDELRARASETLGLDVALHHPYKVCDLRPAFGDVFRDELEGFAYWGHCDLDMIFGDLQPLAQRLAEQRWLRLLVRGHFSLYRNDSSVNSWYRAPEGGPSYVDVFTDPAARTFDEWGGINQKTRALGIPEWEDDHAIFDINFKRYLLQPTWIKTRSPRAYSYDCGRLHEHLLVHGSVKSREGLLVHLQKRRMAPPQSDVKDSYWILPNGFAPKSQGSQQAATIRRTAHSQLLSAAPFHVRRARRRLIRLRGQS